MKIAILGGSFDPPHLGHILIARQVKEKLAIDKVWLMPCYQHPFDKTLSLPTHRLAMTQFLKEEEVEASEFEIKQRTINYTIDTLDALQKKYPEDTFYWIVGSDQLTGFQRWKSWQTLCDKHNLIIFPRDIPTFEFLTLIKTSLDIKNIPSHIIVLSSQDLIETNISSSVIRKRVKAGKSIRYLVLPKVEEYINEHKLYKK